MTLRPDNTLITNREMLVELALTPFRAVVAFFERLSESNARAQALAAVGAMTDEELKAKGLTRADAIALVFRHDA